MCVCVCVHTHIYFYYLYTYTYSNILKSISSGKYLQCQSSTTGFISVYSLLLFVTLLSKSEKSVSYNYPLFILTWSMTKTMLYRWQPSTHQSQHKDVSHFTFVLTSLLGHYYLHLLPKWPLHPNDASTQHDMLPTHPPYPQRTFSLYTNFNTLFSFKYPHGAIFLTLLVLPYPMPGLHCHLAS